MEHFRPIQILLYAFPGIPDSEAEELVERGEVRSYPPNTVLCHEGSFESMFYIILDGEVQVTKVIDPGAVRVLKRLESGDFFGEMAIIQNAPRAATVTAITPTTVLQIHRDAFDLFLRRSASLSLAMVREVSRRLRENDEMAIGELRLKATELATAYQKLAEQDFARREFISRIAHELRTPLTTANGLLYMIHNDQIETEALPGALSSVYRNVQQVVSLVNDILFLQEMDLILGRFQPLDLAPLLEGVVKARQQDTTLRGMKILLEIKEASLAINGDARSLERALAAVLDNAIKFSPGSDQVVVQAWTEEQEIWVVFKDRGVGIPNYALPQIFDRFFHLDQIGDHLFRGLGLGLSIARQVIDQHNGKIKVESELNQGTVVTIRLKMAQ